MASKGGSEAVLSYMGMESKRRKIPIHEKISKDEVKVVISRLKVGKTPKVDRIPAMLKSGGSVEAERLHKMCTCLWKSGRILDGWTGGVIVPLYKGKGHKDDLKYLYRIWVT